MSLELVGLLKLHLTHYSPVLLFCTSWEHQKTFRFSNVCRGYRKATPGCNGWTMHVILWVFRASDLLISSEHLLIKGNMIFIWWTIKGLEWCWTKDLTGCIQQIMSCSESTIPKLKLYSNLLIPYEFACLLLVCFASHVIIFGSSEQANVVSEGCVEKFHKIIHKTVVMESFF